MPDNFSALATWAEVTAEQQGQLIDLVAATILVILGESSVAFSREDLTNVAKDYTITRELKGGDWVITVRPKDAGQGSLPL